MRWNRLLLVGAFFAGLAVASPRTTTLPQPTNACLRAIRAITFERDGATTGEGFLWTRADLYDRIRSAEAAQAALQPDLQRVADRMGNRGRVSLFTGRVKEVASLREKLRRKEVEKSRAMDLDDIDDVLAFRFVLQNPADLPNTQRSIRRALGDSYEFLESKQYDRGYRAQHIMGRYTDPATGHSEPFEVQIMTRRMSAWSDWNHSLFYKMNASDRRAYGPEYLGALESYNRAIAEYLQALDDGRRPRKPSTEGIRPEHVFPGL